MLRKMTWLLMGALSHAGCIPITEAPKKIGDTVCVTGKVVKVAKSQRSGTHFLNFCENYKECPFTVVIFSRNLPDVGDIRWLEGKTIDIHGKVKEYKGQAEIILTDARQLTGEAAKLPALPRNFDVETKGNYNPGTFIAKKEEKKKSSKRSKKGDDASLGEADPNPPPQ